MSQSFRLHDLEFPIQRASLCGCLYDDVAGSYFWNIEVCGEGRLFGDECVGKVLSPRFYWHRLPVEADDWRRLEGFRRVFHADVDQDAPEFDDGPVLYVCAHLPLPRFEIELSARQRNVFALRWTGRADANWDEDFGRDMPFRMELPIAFEHQEVRFLWPDVDDAIDDQAVEHVARAAMRRHGLHDDALRFSRWERFSDDPAAANYRLIRAFFLPESLAALRGGGMPPFCPLSLRKRRG